MGDGVRAASLLRREGAAPATGVRTAAGFPGPAVPRGLQPRCVARAPRVHGARTARTARSLKPGPAPLASGPGRGSALAPPAPPPRLSGRSSLAAVAEPSRAEPAGMYKPGRGLRDAELQSCGRGGGQQASRDEGPHSAPLPWSEHPPRAPATAELDGRRPGRGQERLLGVLTAGRRDGGWGRAGCEEPGGRAGVGPARCPRPPSPALSLRAEAQSPHCAFTPPCSCRDRARVTSARQRSWTGSWGRARVGVPALWLCPRSRCECLAGWAAERRLQLLPASRSRAPTAHAAAAAAPAINRPSLRRPRWNCAGRVGVMEGPGDSLEEAMSGEGPEVRPVAEDGSNGGSSSPSPGDTLPWNLGKTQRSRRSGGGSGANGSVLDPAERAVIRIAGKGEGPRWSTLLIEHLLCAACKYSIGKRALRASSVRGERRQARRHLLATQ
nr:uncharacterized protein LOC111748852 [Loxodonta africana]